ncbi:MAG: GH32 C-terminal domain-containing protein, partial [Clostridia bacterium]|nr:GH32 C-terminal domain-containing protein [Clostridia bacterium]
EPDALSVSGIRKMPVDERKKHKITVVLDLYSVEIFADGRALSSVICPDFSADAIKLSADADSCVYKRCDVSGSMSMEN